MNKAKEGTSDILPEYDFSGGVRGKYARRFAEGSNVVVLDPDLAQRFGSSEAVNRALRGLVELADHKVKRAAVASSRRSDAAR